MALPDPVNVWSRAAALLRRARKSALRAPVFCALLATSAYGSSYTWNVSGSGGGAWNVAGNWTATSGPPGSTTLTTNLDTATFTSVGSGVITVDTHRNLENITFATSAGAFTLSSGTLYMTSGGEIQTTGTGVNSENINSAVVLEGSYTFSSGYSSSNTLNFGGAISSGATSGVTTLTLAGTNTGTNTISGGISNGGGGNSVAVSITGGKWAIAGLNSYSGGVDVSSGTLFVNSNSALGSGTLEIGNGATIDSTVSGVSVSTAPPLLIDGNFTFGGTNSLNLGTGLVTFSSATPTVTLNGNGSTLTVGTPSFPSSNGSGKSNTLTVTDDGTSDTFAMDGLELHLGNQAGTTNLTGNGNINVTGTITAGHTGDLLAFAGTGTLTIEGNTSYTGATTDQGAVFVMNGQQTSASAVTVGGSGSANNSPTLGGTGTITGAVSVSAKSGSIVSIVNPGIAAGSGGSAGTATLTLSGGITFGTSSDYKVNISGGNADELLVSGGNLAIGTTDTLTLNTLSAPTAGDYVLASVSGSGDTLSGTFSASGTPTGYTLVYTSTALNLQHNAVLSIVPTQPNYNARVSTSTTVGVIVTDSAPSGGASLTYGLTGNVTGSSLGPLTASGTGSTTTASYSVPSAAGVNNLSVTGTDANNSGDNATASFTVTGYTFAKPTYTSTLTIGNVRVGTVTNETITNTTSNATYQDGLNVTATNGSNSNLTVGSPGEITAGTSGTVTYTASSAGSLAATSSLGLVSNANGVSGLSNSSLGGSVAVTGAAYNYASPTLNTTGTISFGAVHEGAASPTGSISITNTAIGNTSYQDSLDVSASSTNGGITGTGINVTAGNTGSLTLTASTATVGSLAGSVTLGYTSNANGVSGLSNKSLGNSSAISTTGNVYSGVGVWSTNGGGTWGTVSATPANWTANGGTPGITAGFANTDSASFGSVLASGTGSVTLDGDNPSLNAITFNDGAASYVIARGTGTGSITLDGNGGNANVTDVAGTHTISAPIELATSANVNVASGQQLTLSGSISGSGPGLTMTGTGTTVLSGTDNYTGATNVNVGKTIVNGMSTGSAFSVANGATIAGTGSIGGGLTVAGGGIIGLQNGTVGTLTVGSLTIGNASTASAMTFDIGGTLGSIDSINDTGALNLLGVNGTTISIGNASGISSLANGNYALVTYSGAYTGSLADLSLSTTSLDGKNLSLTQGTDVIYLTVATPTTGTTYTLATTAGSTLLHSGATTTLTTTVTNTGTSPADTLDYSGLGATASNGSVTGTFTSGGPLATSGGSAINTQTYTATTAGSNTISATGSGTNATVGGSATLSSSTGTTINVYSGVGVWNTNGGGTWGTVSATPANWTANGGTPGITAGFANTDSASFGTILASGTGSVTLDGENPSMNAITFNDSAASYVIAQGTGTGSITLDGNGGNATVTDVAGTHTISAPIELATSANVNVASGQQLTMSGTISGTGGLVNNGSGTTILSGNNGYSGGTTVSSGILQLSNGSGSATGSGALIVGPGATLAGAGSSSGSSFSITGNSSTAATVLVGHNTASDLNTTGVMSLTATGGSSIGAANLVFNINSNVAGQSNQLNVGATAITFNTVGSMKTTLTLNVEGTSFIAGYTTYVLVAGTGTTSIAENGTTSGQYSGLTTFLNSRGQEEIETAASNLQLKFADPTQAGYYAPSYLFLSNNDGVDDIEVEVVPEPATWAMIFGGLMTLVFWQRIRRQQQPRPGKAGSDKSRKWPI